MLRAGAVPYEKGGTDEKACFQVRALPYRRRLMLGTPNVTSFRRSALPSLAGIPEVPYRCRRVAM